MTLSDLATADILIETSGALRAMTRKGGIWLHDNVVADPWQWAGNTVNAGVVTAENVSREAHAAGLRVAE